MWTGPMGAWGRPYHHHSTRRRGWIRWQGVVWRAWGEIWTCEQTHHAAFGRIEGVDNGLPHNFDHDKSERADYSLSGYYIYLCRHIGQSMYDRPIRRSLTRAAIIFCRMLSSSKLPSTLLYLYSQRGVGQGPSRPRPGGRKSGKSTQVSRRCRVMLTSNRSAVSPNTWGEHCYTYYPRHHDNKGQGEALLIAAYQLIPSE